MIKAYKKISSMIAFKSKYLKVRKDEFIGGNGKKGVYYYVSDKKQRVHAIGLSKERNLILTKQYRYPIKKIVIDVAGGTTDNEENLEEAATREFFEETGYQGKEIIFLGKSAPEQAKADYWLYEYLIKNVEQKGKIHGGDIAEETEVYKIPLNRAWQYIKNNKIDACASISTLTKALLYLNIKPE